MANVFQKLLNVSSFETKQKMTSALSWFEAKASTQRVSPGSMLKSDDYKSNLQGGVVPGSMFLFQYDAKTKDTLPYWDAYPLVFPFEMTGDGFLGLNLHYLPPSLRASLLSNLASVGSKKPYEDLKLSYSILNKYSRLSYFKPCVKKYLYSQVRSKFLYIEPEEWPIAIFLPLQRFQKSGSGKVYADSRAMLGIKDKKK